MKVSTEKLENCEALLTVELDDKARERLLKAAARRIARKVKIPGFRPGKAPYELLVRRFGEDVIRDEAIEDLTDEVFAEALKQSGIEPYAPASLESVDWEPLVMKARVPTEPEVELGDYADIRISSPAVRVTKADLEEALENLREQYATWKPVERGAHVGDRVQFSIEQSFEGEVIGREEDQEFILEEPAEGDDALTARTYLLGMAAGDERVVSLTYPEEYADARLAGKTVDARVQVTSVHEKLAYPLDDTFAEVVGDFDSLEALKEKLRQDLREQKQRARDDELAEKMLERISETARRVVWPAAMEEREIAAQLERLDASLRERGLSLDHYLTMQQKSLEDFRAEVRTRVQSYLRRNLILRELAKMEKLTVEPEEIFERYDVLNSLAGDGNEEVRELLSSRRGIEMIGSDLVMAKLRQRLAEIARGERPAEDAEEVAVQPEPAEALETVESGEAPGDV